jgi:WD40 repeat protein
MGLARLWSAELPDFSPQLRWSPDGSRLLLASLAGPVVALNAVTGETVWSVDGHAGGALCIAYSPDGTRALSGGQDERVRLLDAATGATLRELDGGGGWVAHAVWPIGDRFATAAGTRVRFWTLDGELAGEVSRHASTVTSLFWSPVTGWGSACYGGVQFLDVTKSAPTKRLPYRGAILVAEPSPDGKLFATGNQDASVRYWDLAERNDASLTGYPGKVRTLCWGAVGPLLATGGGANIVVWRCEGRGPVGTAPLKLTGHNARVTALAFLDGGRTLVSAGEDGRICQWLLGENGELTCVAHDCVDVPLRSMVVDPVARRVAASARGGAVHAWELIAT